MIAAKSLLVLGASMLGSAISAAPSPQEADKRYVQIAHIEIDPAQLANYQAAVKEQIDAAIRNEPGVLVLYAVADKDNPTRVTVFEIYKDIDAYRAHLNAPHYKAETEAMVKSLTLVQSVPVVLGSKIN